MVLPEKAMVFFNKEGEELLKRLRQKEREPQIGSGQRSGRYALKLDEKDIMGVGEISSVDLYGEKHERFFIDKKERLIGLVGDDFQRCLKMVNSLANKKDIRKLVGVDWLLDNVFKWFEVCTNGGPRTTFTAHMESQMEVDCRPRTIAIPIDNLEIQGPFEIGRVQFRVLSEADLKACMPPLSNEDFEIRFRKRYQGSVFGFVECFGEPEKCRQFSENEVDHSLIVLRFIAKGAFMPRMPCYTGKKGSTLLPSRISFSYSGSKVPTISESALFLSNPTQRVGHKQLKGLACVTILSELLKKEDWTDFEDTVFNSVYLYSRAVMAKEFEEKLVLYFVAMENLLLGGGSSEPVSRTAGHRLAFLVGKSTDERKELIALIKKAHGYRGRFIHHGQRKVDYELLRNFQHAIWNAINLSCLNFQNFESKEDLHSQLEERILM